MDGGTAGLAPEVYAVASEVLGVDVAELCSSGASGPADLTSTRWAQPAIVACGVAAFTVLAERGETFTAAAGHSIGEYTALVVAGALDLAQAMRLVALRAEAMDEAGRINPGGMVAVMRLERDVLEEICERNGVGLAADNSAGQLVIAGEPTGLAQAKADAAAAGGKCMTLDVAGAFHSPCMAPATSRLAAALDDVGFAEPVIDVWSTTAAAQVRSADEMRSALVRQLESPVLFRETVERMSADQGNVFTDLGPGKVVGGLARRIITGAEVRYASDLVSAPQGGTS